MNTTSWTVDNLTNGANYEFRVTPIGKGGTGAPSNIATAKPMGPAPGPTQMTATVDGKKVTLNWNRVTNSTGVYIWMRDKTGDGVWVKSEWTIFDGWAPFEMPGTKAGADYEFKVQTANGVIPGDFSNVVSVHTGGPTPGAPTLTASAVSSNAKDGNYVDLHWTAVANANSYYVELRDASIGEAWKRLPLPTWSPEFRSGWMRGGDRYEYRIVAHNDYVAGKPSNVVAVYPPVAISTTWSRSKEAAARNVYANLTAADIQHINDEIALARKVHPNDWNVPGSPGWNGLQLLIERIVKGRPALGDAIRELGAIAVSGVIVAGAIAACPETGFSACVFAAGVLSSVAGQCVSPDGCKDKNSLLMAMAVGAIPIGPGGAGKLVVDDLLHELPATAPKLARLGSTGSNDWVMDDIKYEAMYEVRSNPRGHDVGIQLNDGRWDYSQGWRKMEQIVIVDGTPVTVHYNVNIFTGLVDDFKIKD